MTKIQEILTYEIQINNNQLYLRIPVSGLINPQFLLKNNNLYIFLYNYSECFLITNIPENLISYISDGSAFLVESLSSNKLITHSIKLFPFH